MTARRKDNGDLEEISSGLKTNAFRIALIVLVASMHPVGREILNSLGFKVPRDAGIVADEVTKKLTELQVSNAITQQSLSSVTERLDNFSGRLQSFDEKFSRFEVDFNKSRASINIVTPPKK